MCDSFWQVNTLGKVQLFHFLKIINFVVLMRVTLDSESITTGKPVALRFQIELEIGKVGF